MGAITEPEIWDYNGYFGGNRTIRLTVGRMDSDARDVFCRGHCHSMALALLELLPDAELMGVWINGYDNEYELEHVFVRLPDGGLLDGNGLTHEETDVAALGMVDGFIATLDYADIEDVQETGFYRRARKDDAMPFARALIEREGVGQADLALAA